MKKHHFTGAYPAETFRFELESILGSRLDGCSFNGIVDKGSFKIRGNYIKGTHGLIRPVLQGDFYEENGITHVAVTPKYSVNEYISQMLFALLFFVIGVCVLIAGRGDGAASSWAGCLCIWCIGLVFIAALHVAFLISARLFIRKFKSMQALKLS